MVEQSDPAYPFLVVDRKKLLEEQSGMEYDAKKHFWCPDDKESYVKCEVESIKGDDCVVRVLSNNDVRTLKKDQLNEMNPLKYEQTSDMSDLTNLNEAAILHILRDRLLHQHIYTYSGLFCVVINPYKLLPIYTESCVRFYRGKRKTEMPPHLYAIADGAFSFMLQDRENQSILITGESGAGKTENTKKVIQYFARVAKMQKGGDEEGAPPPAEDPNKPKKMEASLEEQIVQCNPPLEAYGNAKTVRNNNSSRFGKFIRIHFGPQGRIAGADIEHYLLEKSRVVSQQKLERNYHIFYQLLSGGIPDLPEKLLLQPPDPSKYSFINQGVLKVDGIDDAFEMKANDEALDVLGFSADEKLSCFKCTSAILFLGEMKFKQGKDEQAEPDGTGEAEKVAFLMAVNATDLLKALLRPKVKVGNEWVAKSQSKDQVAYAVATLAKSLYSRMFDWMVKRCNQTLDTNARRQYFIGVLDIAGFEIFESNSFEQLCINYTNERLQQFFNHHMFVLEQEEYKKEGIVWEFINFGMDLQACIDLIEKPMGIMSILEEECMFPKASDKSLVEKLYQNHLGKSPNFTKPAKQKPGIPEVHFELKHYAGCVGYNCNGWLERNKDPINQSVVELMSQSKDALVQLFFPPPEDDAAGGGKKKKGGGSMSTISSAHRESLNRLMKNLYSTHPHFVRCIIPNEIKKPFEIDSHLVLHQLRCNGVLEGIRICRKGFPNRVLYPDFRQRYTILAPNAVPAGFVDAKVVAEKVLGALSLGEGEYRLGHTKVFFKAGILGKLEEMRDTKLSSIMTSFQAWVRSFIMNRKYRKLVDQRTALALIQRNIRKYMAFHDWKWWHLYVKIKPLLTQMRGEDEVKKQEEEFKKTKEELARIESLSKQLEEQNVVLLKQKNEIFQQLQAQQDVVGELEEKLTKLLDMRGEEESNAKELEGKLADEEARTQKLEEQRNQLEQNIQGLKGNVADLEATIAKAEQDKTAKDSNIRKLQDEMAQQDQSIAKLSKEKKALEETQKKLTADLQAEEDKVNHLNKTKQKLEQTIDEMEENLQREKRVRADVEKAKRKLETDLKMSQEAAAELDRAKHELEDLVRKKDGEIAALNTKIEEDSSLIAQLQKKIKELQRRIEELEEELEAERQGRAKAERARADLQRQLDEMAARLDEAGGASAAAQELNKRREAEMQKLRQDAEDSRLQFESQLAGLKKKSQDQVNELMEQVDNLQKAKQRAEKERQSAKKDAEDLAAQMEQLARTRGGSDRVERELEKQMAETQGRLDEQARVIQELQSGKNRATADAAEFQKQLEEAEHQIGQLSKMRSQLQAQLEEARHTAEEESRGRNKAVSELRGLQAELDRLREQLDEESEAKASLQRQLQKAAGEMQQLRARLASGEGGDGMSEDAKRKMQARISEYESQIESLMSKIAGLEKSKHKVQGELEDMTVEVERSQAFVSQAEKKQRQIDKVISEFQAKIQSLQQALEGTQRESRGFCAEVFTLRSQLEEAVGVQDTLRRENKNLADEIKDLVDQLSDGGKSIHEIEKAKRRLEMEKQELHATLEDTEAQLEAEVGKTQRSQIELAQYRADIEKRIADKDEEMEQLRRNQQRAIESMQATLEAEVRARTEATKQKKKLETEVAELEAGLDQSNRIRAELDKGVKRLQQQLIDTQRQAEDEARQREELREQLGGSERRCAAIHAQLEELRAALEIADRGRRTAEGELKEASDKAADAQLQNATLAAVKRKLETELTALMAEIDEITRVASANDEKAKRAQAEAQALVDQLRAANDQAAQLDKARKTLETQVRDLQGRLDESEAAGLRGGRKAIARLEQRVHEIEAELEAEQHAHQETAKAARRADNRAREAVAQIEEDRKNQERLQQVIESLQARVKAYKRQVEEAEEIAALNLNKYRKVQHEFEDALERVDQAEQALARARAHQRKSGTVPPSSGSSGATGEK